MNSETTFERLTLADYENAVFAQSACNSIALINALHRLLPRIKGDIKAKTGNDYDTESFNKHLIVRAFLGQLSYLAGESLGPSSETLNELDAMVEQLKLAGE